MSSTTEESQRILIVDDCIEDRETYKRYLSKNGLFSCDFIEAETLGQTWEYLSHSKPACLLLDYLLPDGNGLDFLEQVAATFMPHEIPIVMLTGQGDEDVIIRALKNGATDYLSKSRVSAEALCRTVYNAIEKGILTRQLREREAEKDRLIVELQDALARVKSLSGLLPICAHCKKVRDDSGYWQQVEVYVCEHSDAVFSHSLCPDCKMKFYPDIFGGDT